MSRFNCNAYCETDTGNWNLRVIVTNVRIGITSVAKIIVRKSSMSIATFANPTSTSCAVLIVCLVGDLNFDSSLGRVRGGQERLCSLVERESMSDEWFQVDQTARN